MACNCSIDSFKNKPFSSLSFNEKVACIARGRPMPELTLEKVRNKKTYRFQKAWYDSNLWLCGCATKQALYCWPCLLFSDTGSSGFSQLNYGKTDVSNFSLSKRRHAASKEHTAAVALLAKFGKMKTTIGSSSMLSTEKHNEMVHSNRYVISRLIDIVCHLAKRELPFRGQSEGMFVSSLVSFLHHIAQTDIVLADHLKSSTLFSETSVDIQNDLIEATAIMMLQNIKKDIAHSNFVSMILDMSDKGQLSTVLRFMSHNKIQERFLNFKNVSSDWSAPGLFAHLKKTLEEFDCGKKIIGLTYDGAAVVAGAHNGLQTLVKNEYPNAIFVHCYAHKINWVLQQSMNSMKSCKLFFQTCSGLAAFFSKSTGHSAAFEKSVNKKFPTLVPARWYYTHNMIVDLYEVQEEVKTLLTEMAHNSESWDVDTRMTATGFLYTMEKQEFKFLLKLFSLIFPKTKVLFNVLQTKSLDMNLCSREIDFFKSEMWSIKSSFQDIWVSSVGDSPCPVKQKRNYEETSYLDLTHEVIQNIALRIQERFITIKDLGFVALLDPANFEIFTTEFPDDAFVTLRLIYGDLFDLGALKLELKVIYSDTDCYKLRTLSELFEYFLNSGLDEALPLVFKLLELCLCIPATSAAVERSNSYLKRMHAYQRNTQGQDMTSHAELISVEKDYLNTLNRSPLFHGQIIDIFKSKNDRQLQLDFK